MSRLQSLLTALLVLALAPVLADSPGLVSFEFPTVRAGESDKRTLERYLRRPGTIRCEFVEFDVGKLIGLIEALDKGEVDVEDSSVDLTIFDDALGIFEGNYFELGREREIPGPYTWGGTLKGESQISVNFVIDQFRFATMILDAGATVYRTHVSRSSGHYFLCKIDGTRPSQRID